MAEIATSQIRALLTEAGKHYQQPATLLLLGGGALRLLGSSRPTLDLDYVGHDLHKTALQQVIEQVAQEMQLEVEIVHTALTRAQEFSLNPTSIRNHLQIVRDQI